MKAGLRTVLVEAFIKDMAGALTVDKATGCLEFARTFASTYPGWDFSFSIWVPIIATPETTVKLGKFALETIVI